MIGVFCATCNILSGKGFGAGLLGPWSKALIGVAIIFFIIALARKWVFESIDQPFNLLIGEAVGLITYIVLTNLLCSYKWALVIALGAGLALGWLLGNVFGGGE